MLTKNPPVFAVCLTRQQLYEVRAALRAHHKRIYYETFRSDAATYDALQKVHAILLDAGGVDDTE